MLYGPGPDEAEPLHPVPDLRGTPVDDADGRPAGELYGSLTDAGGGLIRYLDLALHTADQHVLVPIGHAEIERTRDRIRIRLRAARREQLQQIPPFEPDEQDLDAGYEHAVLAAHGRLFEGERYYAHPAYDHSGLYAGDHPIVQAGDADEQPVPLAALSELSDYRVAEGEPDIRGWPVVTGRGERAGAVRDLLVDTGAEKVRYAVVVLEGGASAALLPVGFLEIEAEAERVRTPALTVDDFRALPPHRPGPLTREAEERIRRTLESRLKGERRFGRPAFTPPRNAPHETGSGDSGS